MTTTVEIAAGESPHRVVRASAGSGKTHRLALRYLEILFSGGKPESIVAATFTREAAGEILGRVLTRLAVAARDGREAERLGAQIGRPELTRRHAERALRAVCDVLDRVVVSTLDSFFFRLTAALRLELGLPGVPAVAAFDDPLLAGLREDALEGTLEALAEHGWHELIDLFERLQGSGARRSVARSLDTLLLELYEIYLEAPDAELWGRLELPPGPAKGELASALGVLDAAVRASAPGPLRKALVADLELAANADWDRLLDRGLTGKLAADPAAQRFGQATIPAPWRQPLAVMVAHARRQIVAAQVDRTRATQRLLEAFHRHYWELRRRRGVLLFSDLATGLVRWLEQAQGSPAEGAEGAEGAERADDADGTPALDELYYRIDARVGHLLLDEFQDTSLAQWSVLRPIAEEIRAWGDGSRTFFCVGDPKQAIYGWRGGCADLFDQIEEDLALDPASGERMDESFRSSQVVLDAVNQVFGRLGSVDALREHAETVERWGASFGDHRARVELPGFVELLESPAAREHDEWAARRVGELAAAMPTASIAVLVQTNEQATATLDALRRLRIEASGEGTSVVADDPAVAAAIAALLLADHPGDTVAAFHVAASPLGPVVGLRAERRRDEGRLPERAAGRLPERTSGGLPTRAAVLAASRRIRGDFVTQSGSALLAGWRRALRGATDGRSRLRLAQAVDLAERFDREGGGRPGDLAALLSRASVESPRRAGVRVMTVHRAKGLEFDVVVLPALDRLLLRGADAPIYLLRRSPLAPVEAVHRSAPANVRRLAPELERGHEQERERRLRDDLSVLYVALTRARHALHLWLEPATTAAGGGASREIRREPSREALSFAAILRDTLARPSSQGLASPTSEDIALPPSRCATLGSSQGAAPPPSQSTVLSSSEGVPLYRAGDLDAVAAALASPRASPIEQQGSLPLRADPGRTGAPGALRPAVGLDQLHDGGELSAGELLAAATVDDRARQNRWRGLDATMAEGTTSSSPEVDGARAWLLADGRRIARREQNQRFACSIGGTTVAGELHRVWVARAPGVPDRALIGAEFGAGPLVDGGAVAVERERRRVARRAELVRLAALRALGCDEADGAAIRARIAVLLGGSGPVFLLLPPDP